MNYSRWWTTLENIQDELQCLGSMDLSFESIIVWKGICELFKMVDYVGKYSR